MPLIIMNVMIDNAMYNVQVLHTFPFIIIQSRIMHRFISINIYITFLNYLINGLFLHLQFR